MRINELSKLLEEFESQCLESLTVAAASLMDAFRKGSKVLICGNGGSAADSQHFAAELVSAFSREIERPALSAIALTVDTSVITAFSNDFNFDNVFARQVEAHGRKGDILIAITTSGSSKNCIAAVRTAKGLGMKTLALTSKGGQISAEADMAIEVPSTNTQHIQECHMVGYHILSELIESALYGRAK
jgi:D-sedoheptulose 7-phosphate isomerase